MNCKVFQHWLSKKDAFTNKENPEAISHLKGCKAAYLFFEKKKNLCSLFIMDYDHLGFEIADGSRFSNIIKGCPTDIWKEKGQVYAMVH